MPGIDTSMYQVPQNDLVGQLQKWQALSNAGEQNKLLQMEQQYMAPQITQQQAQLYAQRLGLVSQKLAEVYGADDGNPTRKHIIDGVSDLMASNPGVFDKSFAAPQSAPIPSGQGWQPQTVQAAPSGNAAMLQRSGPLAPNEGITIPAGTVEANTVAATESARQAADLQASAARVPARQAILANMQDAASKFTSGPLAHEKKTVQAAWNEVAPSWLQSHPEAVAAQEEFGKYAAQLAKEFMNSGIGTESDRRLMNSIAANPNEALSNLGSRRIVQILQGTEDALAAQNTAWTKAQKQYGGPAGYGRFLADFNKDFDPRVFQFNRMDNDARGEFVKGMTGAQKKQFRGAIEKAEAKGWISAE